MSTDLEIIDWRNLPPLPEDERPHMAPEWTPSQTFLRHHDRCDHAAYLYLRWRAGAGGHQLNRGAIAHVVYERLLRMIAANQAGAAEIGDGNYHPTPWEKAEAIDAQAPPELGREVLDEVLREFAHLQVPANERDALRYMVDHWCRGTFFPNTIIGVEITLTLEINGFRVLARADLAEDLGGGMCQITDWKTAFAPSSEEFTRQAYDRDGNPRWAGNYQLNVLGVLAHFGLADDGMPLGKFDRYRLVLGFPRELRPEGIVQRFIDVTPIQLEAYREDLSRQLDRLREVNIGEGRWQPTPGHHCAECPAQAACPLPPVLRPESQHAGDDLPELERAAAKANFMAGTASTIRRRIKKRAEVLEQENPGALALPSGDVGIACGKDVAMVFVPSETETVRDKVAFRQAVEDRAEHGTPIDWDQHYRISQSTKFEKRRVA